MSESRERPLTRNIRPGQGPPDLRQYESAGGYEALRKAIKMSWQVIASSGRAGR